jgi:hypothetical protein
MLGTYFIRHIIVHVSFSHCIYIQLARYVLTLICQCFIYQSNIHCDSVAHLGMIVSRINEIEIELSLRKYHRGIPPIPNRPIKWKKSLNLAPFKILS